MSLIVRFYLVSLVMYAILYLCLLVLAVYTSPRKTMKHSLLQLPG